MALHTFLGTLKQKFSSNRQLKKHELLIRRSGKFDESFYIKNYSQIGSEGIKNPVRHYLIEGASLGYNPTTWFNSSWYVEQYEDVKEHQFNPLVHYIMHGRREGRKPNPNQFESTLEKKIDQLKNGVVENLWGGYSSPALEELSSIYTNSSADVDLRFFAAWHAARWYYFVEDFEKALSISELVRDLSSEYHLDKTAVLMHSFCLMKLGQIEKAKLHLYEYLETVPEDADVLLSMSNLCKEPSERLAWINEAYERNGFMPIDFNESTSKLSFESLIGQAPSVEDERLVSVIIPTFNAGTRLAIAIKSLLNQSWQNIEVIVVDDCSTDDTPKLVKELAIEDSRLKLVQQKQNGGAYRARNAGLQVAKGDFITTHDGDDWSHPQKIESQIAYLDAKPTVMGVSTHWIRATNDLHFQHNWRLNPRLIHWSHSSFLFRREVLNDLGPWDNVIAGGDTEFIWRVQAKYGKWAFKKIHKEVPMAFALDDDGSLTRNKATHIKTMHNGLRHIYRSACQWWHKTNPDNLFNENGLDRNFPAPKSMVVRGDNSAKAELIFISDFSQKRFKASEVEIIKMLVSAGHQVALYHVPEYGKITRPICDQFFELLMNENVTVCVYGMEITAKYAVFLNQNLLNHVPDQLAAISVDEVFIKKNGNDEPELTNVNFFVARESTTKVTTVDKLDLLSTVTSLFFK
ncbi:MAG: glycosyltransferase family 2 protein [Pseudomonadota bacterium]|nr:glycosyltransferase family 2 protein [Pseudomonadota bacterium]